MKRANTNKFVGITLIIVIISVLGLGACNRIGPLETELNRLEKQYSGMLVEKKADRGAFIQLLKKLVPLLSEKNYSDSADIGKQKDIMYRASILLIRVAGSARLEKAARAFYMNAYLLRPDRALQDIREKLPPKTDLTIFRGVHVPAYKIKKRSSGTLKFPAKVTDAAVRERARSMTLDVRVNKIPANFLLQMVCGHALHKLKDEHGDLGKLHVRVGTASAPAATCRWNFVSDELVLHLPNER